MMQDNLVNNTPLSTHVYTTIENYLESIKDLELKNLYDFFLDEIEVPLLDTVMKHTRGNQVQAAKLLGISRGTLRKKLERHFGGKYFKIKE